MNSIHPIPGELARQYVASMRTFAELRAALIQLDDQRQRIGAPIEPRRGRPRTHVQAVPTWYRNSPDPVLSGGRQRAAFMTELKANECGKFRTNARIGAA